MSEGIKICHVCTLCTTMLTIAAAVQARDTKIPNHKIKKRNGVNINSSNLQFTTRVFKRKQRMKKEMHFSPRGFSFEGRETVSTKPLIEKSFSLRLDLKDDEKVAEYDESVLRKYWNSNVIQQNWKTRLFDKWKHGVIKRTFPLLMFFIFLHYLLSILILTTICTQKSFDKDAVSEVKDSTNTFRPWVMFFLSREHESINSYEFCKNYAENNVTWNEKERNMTRFLTFLIGFYVGFIVRNYWQILRYFPTIDSLCIGIGSFVIVSPGVDENKAGIKIDNSWISIKQLKKDIVRLTLLSWTMCMSRISKNLKSKFMEPVDYNRKKLLTYQEYEQLTTQTDDDCWLEKWTIPLVWVNKIVSNVNKDTKVTDENGTVKIGVRFDAPKQVGDAIYKIKDKLQMLSNSYDFFIPHIMLQCITLAMYFFMFLGVFASQGQVFDPHDNRTIAVKLLCDFPLYFCVKYCLLIGWLKAAKDLQNPFGEDL